MAKIYLSYARVDKDLTAAVHAFLSELGHEVLLDVDSITPGHTYLDALDEALRNSDVFVALITPASTQTLFMMTELGAAMAYARESGRMLVVPVIIGDAPLPIHVQGTRVLVDQEGDARNIASQVSDAVATFIGNRIAAQQKDEEARQRIEESAADYVSEAVSAQEQAEKRYRMIGTAWYVVGLAALIAGLAFVGLSLARTDVPEGDWTSFAFIALRSVIVIGILVAGAKYAFTLGRSFTIESLKCADRLHAIAFGRFYLRVYGQQANWQELKEAFANWNIDRASAFSDTRTSDFDPKILELLTDLARAVGSAKNA